MLYCFGGAILSALMLAEPPVAPLSNDTNVLLASLIWYLVFYCPQDLVYRSAALLPVRLVLSGMKEVTRTWKVLGGVAQAQKHYKEGILVMIAAGWAKGAGGGLISNFEQLVRGIWKPETNELLKMSYPTKVTLMGAVIFSLQQCQYLPIQKHHLMFIYTVFLVVNKSRMMLSGSSSWPFAPVEGAMYRVLFAEAPTDCASAAVAKAKAPVRAPSPDTCAAAKEDVKEALDSHNGSAVSDTDVKVSRSPKTEELRALDHLLCLNCTQVEKEPFPGKVQFIGSEVEEEVSETAANIEEEPNDDISSSDENKSFEDKPP
ncbi:hypothetical protein JZ751_012274, partial [Albula glossodonta]